MRYANIFMEMAVTEILFSLKLERRGNYWIRMPIAFLLFAVTSFFIKYLALPDVFSWVKSFYPLLCGVLFVIICYKLPVQKAVCFGIISYAIQHTSFILLLFVMSRQALSTTLNSVIDYLLYIGVLAAYWGVFGRNAHVESVISLNNIKQVLLCIFMLVISYVLIVFVHELSTAAEIVAGVSNVVCIFLSLALLFGLSREDELAKEKRQIEQILKREEELHRLSKENIDIINYKCHDLKHRLDAIRAGGVIPETEIAEMEQAVALYEGSVKTGNDDLDIVFAEKTLRCSGQGVTIASVIDGKQLGFMSSGDIYSLFGNALDNAIEYLVKVEDRSKRLINVTVQRTGGFIGIQVENYCEDKLTFENGLPKTSKKDKNFHGFGLKSMRYIVEKYGGTLCCEREEDTFVVNVIFPAEQGGRKEPQAKAIKKKG